MKINKTKHTKLPSACKLSDTICLPDSYQPRMVIIGGGFAGLALEEKLKHKEAQVVLIDRNNFHQFQSLLYLGATSALEPDSILISEDIPKGHPQVAQTAIQSGKYLGDSLLKLIKNEPVKPFECKDKGSLATAGKRMPVADLGKFEFTGYFAWLLWSIEHLLSISGFRNKFMVGLNWVVSYFTYEKSNHLIIRKFKPNHQSPEEII
jgi:NADH dehydrogenase FAD-containing subunit